MPTFPALKYDIPEALVASKLIVFTPPVWRLRFPPPEKPSSLIASLPSSDSLTTIPLPADDGLRVKLSVRLVVPMPTFPLFATMKFVVVPLAVEEAIAKSGEYDVSEVFRWTESCAQGVLLPSPNLPFASIFNRGTAEESCIWKEEVGEPITNLKYELDGIL